MAQKENSTLPTGIRLPRGSILKSYTGSKTEVRTSDEKLKPNLENSSNVEYPEESHNNITEYDQSSLQEVIIPPDGGYGWVIVCAAFLSNMVADGIIYSFGSLIDPIYKEYKDLKEPVPISSIAWIGSVTTAFYLFVGPFVAVISNRYGFRVAAIAGSTIAFVGFVLAFVICMVKVNLPGLIFCYGIIGGIGLGFVYMPAVVAPGFYFDKKRSLATGISMCGSGIGTFLVPPIIESINSFKGSAHSWHYSILFSAVFVLCCIPLALFYRPLRPTIVHREHCRNVVVNRASIAGAPFIMPMMIASPEYTEDFEEITDRRKSNVKYMSDTNILEGLTKDERRKSIVLVRRRSTVPTLHFGPSESTGEIGALPEKTPVTQEEKSLMEIHRYVSDKNIHTSSGDVVTEEQEIVIIRHKEPCCPTSCFDFSLLSSPTFNLTLLSGFLNMVGLFIPFIYLKGIAIGDGVKEGDAKFLTSLIGIGTCCGRLIGGWIADLPKINGLFVCNCSITAMGVSTAVVPFLKSHELYILYALVYGFSMGCSSALRPTILTELLGLEKLTNAFGLTLVVFGVASMIGTPLAGKLEEWSGPGGNKKVPFFVGGGCMTFSGVINYPLYSVKRWEDRRSKENPDTKNES